MEVAAYYRKKGGIKNVRLTFCISVFCKGTGIIDAAPFFGELD